MHGFSMHATSRFWLQNLANERLNAGEGRSPLTLRETEIEMFTEVYRKCELLFLKCAAGATISYSIGRRLLTSTSKAVTKGYHHQP